MRGAAAARVHFRRVLSCPERSAALPSLPRSVLGTGVQGRVLTGPFQQRVVATPRVVQPLGGPRRGARGPAKASGTPLPRFHLPSPLTLPLALAGTISPLPQASRPALSPSATMSSTDRPRVTAERLSDADQLAERTHFMSIGAYLVFRLGRLGQFVLRGAGRRTGRGISARMTSNLS